MAELASVKVALLDIGKEQRKKEEEKIRRGTSSCQFQTPCAQSGSQDTCILMPTPSLHILTLFELPAGS